MAIVTKAGAAYSNAIDSYAHSENTVSATLPSDCDFIAISFSVNNNLTVPALTSITVDGVSASDVSGCDVGELSINGYVRLYAYGLINPNTGTINIVASMSSSVLNSVLVVQGYKNVNQTTPTEGGNNALIDDDGGSAFNLSPTTTTVDGDYLFANINSRGDPANIYCLDNELSNEVFSDSEVSFVCGDVATTGSGGQVRFHKGGYQLTSGWVFVIKQAETPLGQSQSIIINLDDISFASSQVLRHSQSLSLSLDDIAFTVNQIARHSQLLTVTLDDITFNITQKAQRQQTFAITLDDISVAVNQKLQHSQSLSLTLDDITASLNQTLTHPQSINVALDDITVLINQEKAGAKSQTINVTLDDIQASLAQKVSYSQTISATLDDIQVTINQTTANANSQAINVILDGIQVSVNQTLNHAQSISATLDDIQVNINQAIAISQTLNITLDGISVTINQVSGVIIYGKIDYYVAKPRNMIYVAKPRNYNHIGQ